MDTQVDKPKHQNPEDGGRGVPLERPSEEQNQESAQTRERLDERVRKAGI